MMTIFLLLYKNHTYHCEVNVLDELVNIYVHQKDEYKTNKTKKSKLLLIFSVSFSSIDIRHAPNGSRSKTIASNF